MCVQISSAALAVLSVAMSATALSAHPQGSLRTVGARSQGRVAIPSTPGGSQAGQAGSPLLYCDRPDVTSDLVGYTFDLTPTGGIALRRQAFLVDLGTDYDFASSSLEYHAVLNDQTLLENMAVNADISTSLGLLDLAASFAASWSTSSSSLEVGFAIEQVNEYDYERVQDFGTVNYTPEAWAILDPSQGLTMEQKEAAWREAGFGTYVATGFDVVGRVGVKVSATFQEDAYERHQFAELQGHYEATSASFTWDSFLQEVSTHKELHLEFVSEGLTPAQAAIQLPDVSAFADASARNQFKDQILALAAQAKTPKGLVLQPVLSMPYAPLVEPPSLDSQAIRQAAVASKDALEVIARADRWLHPSDVKRFIDNLTPPQGGLEYGVRLDHALNAVAADVATQWNAAQGYFHDPKQTTLDYLLARRTLLNQSISALGSLCDDIQVAVDQVAPSTMEVIYIQPLVSTTCAIQIRLNDVAYFGTNQQVMSALNVPDGGGNPRVHISSYTPGSVLGDHVTWNPRVDTVTPGDIPGTVDVLFTFSPSGVSWQGGNTTQWMEFEFTDDLGRDIFHHHDFSW